MNRKRFFVLACGLIVSAAFGQSASPTLTYQTTGKPLDQILTELTPQAPMRLVVDAALAKDVLAMSLDHVRWDDLRERLERVENAHWEQRDGTMVLTQTAEQRRTLEQLHRARVVASFAKAIAAQQKLLDDQAPFDSQAAEAFSRRAHAVLSGSRDLASYLKAVQALEVASPCHRAAVRVLSAFSAEEFAALPLRLKVAYSDQPTSSELPLPDKAADAVRTFIAEQNAYLAVAQFQPLTRAVQGGIAAPLPPFLASRAAITGAAAKTLVSFYRESERGKLFIQIQVASSDGKVLAESTTALRPLEESGDAAEGDSAASSHPVVVSADAIPLTPLAGGTVGLGQLRETLLHPEGVDPLGVAYGSTLVQVAHDAGVNLMALLSDRLLDGNLRQSRFDSAVAYLRSLAARGQSSSLDGRWLQLEPADPFADRSSRADRDAIGEFLRASVSNSFSVEQQAKCALALPTPMENDLALNLLAVIENRMEDLSDVALLRFYGALSDEERLQARSAAGLNLAALAGRPAALALNEIVYARINPLIVPRSRARALWREPSECLAGGLDPGATLRLTVESVDGIFDRSKDALPPPLSGGALTPGQLAFEQFRSTHPDNSPDSGPQPVAERFQLGTLSTYTFSFQLLPDVSCVGSLHSRYLQGGRLTFDQLPVEFLAEVSRSLEQIQADAIRFHARPESGRTGSAP